MRGARARTIGPWATSSDPVPSPGTAAASPAAAVTQQRPSRTFGGEDYLDPDLPAAIDDEDEPLSRRVWIKCGVVLCTIVGGILFVAGLVFVLASSRGGATADELAYAAAAVNSTSLTQKMSASLFNVSGGVALVKTTTIVNVDPTHGTPSVTSVRFDGTMSVSRDQTWFLLTSANPASSVNISVPITGRNTTSVSCVAASCAIRSNGDLCSNATSEGIMWCNATSMKAYCVANFGPNASFEFVTPSVATCAVGDVCGSCVIPAYLSQVCVVVTASGAASSPWTQVPYYASCEFDFRTRSYGAAFKSAIPVTVRTSTDAYLAMQLFTRGQGAFGSVPGSTSATGIALLVVGSILAVACVSACVYLLITAKDAAEEEEEDRELRRARGLQGAKRRAAIAAADARQARRPEFESEPRRHALYRAEAERMRSAHRRESHSPAEATDAQE